ncbi:MAG: hypothetical protein A2Y69_00685 [Candidatus Aminicenantes bacterium RBG_13_59_9]|nr:MAG: hypothetical protein A2Y69_00685 [Candidatus Aminicenantes bacterium RBG_13_59_9]
MRTLDILFRPLLYFLTMAGNRLRFCVLVFMVSLLIPGCRKAGEEVGELDRLAGPATDKSSAGHGFLEIYERFFSPLRNSATKICEIGISEGASLLLWEKYFPKAMIHGIDILDRSNLESKRIKTFQADQSNRLQLLHFIKRYGGGYDFILDDGGHAMDQQQISVGFLFPYVKPGGYYIIEDLHPSLPHLYSSLHEVEGGADSTLTMLNHFIARREIESKYMTVEESRYLKQNIEFVVLFQRNIPNPSITGIIKKKKIGG